MVTGDQSKNAFGGLKETDGTMERSKRGSEGEEEAKTVVIDKDLERGATAGDGAIQGGSDTRVAFYNFLKAPSSFHVPCLCMCLSPGDSSALPTRVLNSHPLIL